MRLSGRAGVHALAAVGLGSAIFMAIALLVQGLAFGVEPFVAQAQGAGQSSAAYRWLVSGLTVTVLASVPLWVITQAGCGWLESFGIAPDLATSTRAYLTGRLPSLPLHAMVCVLRVYLQASGRSRSIIGAALVMNAFNFVANYVLLFGMGTLRIPPLGVFGLGLGSTLATLLQVGLMAYVAWQSRGAEARGFPVKSACMRQISPLGCCP